MTSINRVEHTKSCLATTADFLNFRTCMIGQQKANLIYPELTKPLDSTKSIDELTVPRSISPNLSQQIKPVFHKAR